MPLKSKLKINKKALAAFEELQRVGGEVQWGLPDAPEVEDYDDDTSVRMVAFVQEFGHENIPARGYFKRSAKKRRRELKQASQDVMFAVAAGRLSVEKALDLVGQQAAATLRKDLTDFKDPGNAPSTIARKGFDNPLIETGHLRSQITHKTEQS